MYYCRYTRCILPRRYVRVDGVVVPAGAARVHAGRRAGPVRVQRHGPERVGGGGAARHEAVVELRVGGRVVSPQVLVVLVLLHVGVVVVLARPGPARAPGPPPLVPVAARLVPGAGLAAVPVRACNNGVRVYRETTETAPESTQRGTCT